MGASVGMLNFLRHPCPGGADAQGPGGGARALLGSKDFFVGQGRDWGGASVPWLMAFQQRVSAVFSLWEKENTAGGVG